MNSHRRVKLYTKKLLSWCLVLEERPVETRVDSAMTALSESFEQYELLINYFHTNVTRKAIADNYMMNLTINQTFFL